MIAALVATSNERPAGTAPFSEKSAWKSAMPIVAHRRELQTTGVQVVWIDTTEQYRHFIFVRLCAIVYICLDIAFNSCELKSETNAAPAIKHCSPPWLLMQNICLGSDKRRYGYLRQIC